MAAKKTKKASAKKGGTMSVDFSEVEDKRGGKRYKPGDYGVKVVEVTKGKTQNKGTPQISFKCKFVEGKYKGDTIFHNCNLLPQSLWVLRNALEALGKKVPKKVVKIDLNGLVGKKMGITIEDDEYENKVRSRVVDTFPYSELEDRQAGTDEELDEDDEDDEDEDEDDDDEDEDDEDEDDDEDDEDEDVEEVDLDDV